MSARWSDGRVIGSDCGAESHYFNILLQSMVRCTWIGVTLLQTSTSSISNHALKWSHSTTYYFYYIEPCLKCNYTTTYYFYIQPCSEVESHYYILLLLHWAMLWSGVTLLNTTSTTSNHALNWSHTTTNFYFNYIEPCSGAESHSSKHGHLQHTRAHVTDCNKWAQGYLLAFEIKAFLRFTNSYYGFPLSL